MGRTFDNNNYFANISNDPDEPSFDVTCDKNFFEMYVSKKNGK